MRTLKIIQHISLDGVIQNSVDDDEFPYTGWNGPYRTAEGLAAMLAEHGEGSDLVVGRRTYDMWSTFWPEAASSPMADHMNAATKHVATHRPASLSWGPADHLGTDVADGIRRLKSQDGPNLVVAGSSTLIALLLEHGLADQVVLAVNPIMLGTGKRFLPAGTPARAFHLAKTQTTSSGIVFSTYDVAGPLTIGGTNDAQKSTTHPAAQVEATTVLPEAMTGRASPAKAAVGDKPVFAYIASLPQPQRGIAEAVDALAARTLPDLRRSVKWGMSYYGVGDGWCFSCGGFAGHVKLMFINGTALDPEPPVTPVGMGRATRGVDLEAIEDLDERQIAAWMEQVASVPGVGGRKR